MPDATDRAIINALQGGFPLLARPFAEVAEALALEEGDLIARIGLMLEEKTLSRFGPMYDVEKMGGAFCLCAMQVPAHRFEEVAEQVNAHPQVAHNYEREHTYNMWFVLATETPGEIAAVTARIESETGLAVLLLPKLEEFFIGLRVRA